MVPSTLIAFEPSGKSPYSTSSGLARCNPQIAVAAKFEQRGTDGIGSKQVFTSGFTRLETLHIPLRSYCYLKREA